MELSSVLVTMKKLRSNKKNITKSAYVVVEKKKKVRIKRTGKLHRWAHAILPKPAVAISASYFRNRIYAISPHLMVRICAVIVKFR
jgi:hypothetical protein